MPKTSIHLLVGIRGTTLLVFHTQAHCWQFRIISVHGDVFGERKTFYSPAAAERVARHWLSPPPW